MLVYYIISEASELQLGKVLYFGVDTSFNTKIWQVTTHVVLEVGEIDLGEFSLGEFDK